MNATDVVVDTSAIVAIVFGEDDAELYAGALAGNKGGISVSAPTLVETRIVTEARLGPAGSELLTAVLERLSVDVVALDASLAHTAIAAWRRFGRGRHPARLNMGDCFSYALASQTGAALLYKGRDFAQTDIRSALA